MRTLADELTPREIVAELDRFIVGQSAAKKAVAVALRNRARRRYVPEPMRDEISPKNILLIGPTGVGKTEIARRLAHLAGAPFSKVEVTKFTEVGYMGRDVDSIVRDLMNVAIEMERSRLVSAVEASARAAAEERVLDALLPPPRRHPRPAAGGVEAPGDDLARESYLRAREKMREGLVSGALRDRTIEIEVSASHASPMVEVFTGGSMEEIDFSSMLGNLMPRKKTRRRIKVGEALEVLAQEEAANLVDMDEVKRLAREKVETSGIIFLDEIDKIVGSKRSDGPDVSREGVQRDLLPLVEGAAVNTRFGVVRTDHILFIAAGAFHHSKPSDLIPELQGRMPIRVELEPLTADDFVRILSEPENALTRQYGALLATEGIGLEFTEDGIRRIAEISHHVNSTTEEIGARRLHTVMERVLEDLLFGGEEAGDGCVTIDSSYVDSRLKDLSEDQDLSRFIL